MFEVFECGGTAYQKFDGLLNVTREKVMENPLVEVPQKIACA